MLDAGYSQLDIIVSSSLWYLLSGSYPFFLSFAGIATYRLVCRGRIYVGRSLFLKWMVSSPFSCILYIICISTVFNYRDRG